MFHTNILLFTFTNLGWRIEARLLEAEFRMQPGTMRLVNDFVANGFGVVTLRDGDGATAGTFREECQRRFPGADFLK